DVMNQRFHESGLAAAGGAGDDDVLFLQYRLLEEVSVAALTAQVQQLAIAVADTWGVFQDFVEEAVFLILRQRLGLLGGQTNGDGYLARVARRRNNELRTLAGRKGQRHHRVGIGDALAGIAFIDDGGAELTRTLEVERGHVHALPTAPAFQIELTGFVDPDFGDVRRRHELPDTQHFVLVFQEFV